MTPDAPASALYRGLVVHQRHAPRRHRLRYRHYALLLDLDELPSLDRRLRWFSLNRFNLFSLHEADHGDGRAEGLRGWVDEQLARAGLPTGGAVRLLTMPRVLGHVFNPLSVYYCHAPTGILCAVLYEVDNTFGQRHSYLIEVDPAEQAGRRVQQRCPKQFYVSPFLGMELEYRFDLEPPSAAHETLRIGVADHDADGPVLTATMAMRRRPLDDAALLGAFASHPLLTLKVVGAIHWEALQLWLKGVPLVDRPPPPPRALTVVRAGAGAAPPAAPGGAAAFATEPTTTDAGDRAPRAPIAEAAVTLR